MYQYSGIVTNVVDGDTVDIMVDLGFKTFKEIRVRLKDIDTPEIFRPSCKDELEHGRLAKLFVEHVILHKTITLVTFKDKTGKYGRYLADIVYTEQDGLAKFLTEELKLAGFEKKDKY